MQQNISNSVVERNLLLFSSHACKNLLKKWLLSNTSNINENSAFWLELQTKVPENFTITENYWEEILVGAFAVVSSSRNLVWSSIFDRGSKYSHYIWPIVGGVRDEDARGRVDTGEKNRQNISADGQKYGWETVIRRIYWGDFILFSSEVWYRIGFGCYNGRGGTV